MGIHPEFAVREEGQEGAVLIKDLGSSGRAVVFQRRNIRQVGKDPHGPQNNEKDAQSESSESGKNILFHGTAIFSPRRFAGEGSVPLTEGTWFRASAQAGTLLNLVTASTIIMRISADDAESDIQCSCSIVLSVVFHWQEAYCAV